MTATAPSSTGTILGRYEILEEIASGGMATVYLGRMVGPVGFSRSVAIKRLHPHLAKEADFVAMFIDEARLAARIRHPNVVPTLDVVATDDDLVLVMEYVEGESLARIMRRLSARKERVPPPIAAAILVGVLYGLHAAHEATNDEGAPLGLIHRDVSPHNIIIGRDGIARVLDFGIAKAAGRLHTTREGRLKGKLSYMSPEHVRGERLTRAADIYSASVVLWEALAGERLFHADNDATLLELVLRGKSDASARSGTVLDRVVSKGLRIDPTKRFATAWAMAREIERETRVASASDVSEWLASVTDGVAWRPSAGEATSTEAMKSPRRRRVLAIGAALLGIGVAVGASAWWSSHRHHQVASEPAAAAVAAPVVELESVCGAATRGHCGLEAARPRATYERPRGNEARSRPNFSRNEEPVVQSSVRGGCARLEALQGRMPVTRDSTEVLDRQLTSKVLAAELIVVAGPDTGERLKLTEGVARIGTAPSNDLRLTDPTVSRIHTELRLAESGILVRDAGSTNGTFIDGLRVGEATASAGATIHIGATSVRVEVGEEPAFAEVSPRDSFGELVGSSIDMRRVFAILERVAASNATVLLQGETGTGKDVAARSIHAASARAEGPFVAVDCGAIAENLIESELFGHVRGAFSGAVSDRAGAFEEANGGTLFFDEIGELPLALQPKLLRALEMREVRRVGSNAARPVDVRIIAATNRHLPAAVNAGTFREDLYYRLAVVTVELPPLRARREDVVLLARHFYRRYRGADAELPTSLIATLVSREWRGNVRELRNFIERNVSIGTPSSPPPPLDPARAGLGPLEALVPTNLPLREARDWWVDQFESAYIRAVVQRAGGNVTRAAELAGVNRRHFQRMMVRVGLRAPAADDDE